jgi:hypothetical protein
MRPTISFVGPGAHVGQQQVAEMVEPSAKRTLDAGDL